MSHPIAPRSVLVVLVVALTAATTVTARPAGADEPVVHLPPVEAPVVDPFRPPATRYGSGNRGLAYDLAPGTDVVASADGTVVFAGPVAGSLHVTVLHDDGIRTSYSFLEGVDVRRGARIARGEVVGSGGAGFHFGARVGDDYIDPASLFGTIRVRVRLVAHDEPPPGTDEGLLREQAALRDLVRTEDPGALDRAWRFVVDRAEPVVDRLRALDSIASSLLAQLRAPTVVVATVEAVWDHHRRACTDVGPVTSAAPAPATDRIALLVAGLGSSHDHGSIDAVDLAALGYDPALALRFSYRGGRAPGEGLDPALAALAANPYGSADTQGDIRAQGVALADLIEATAAARPGAPIDVFAHSLGGIVTRLALLELASRPGGVGALGSVVTIGTPHRGADLGTDAVALGGAVLGDLATVGDLVGAGIEPDALAVAQLAETSDLIAELDAAGVPDGVDLRTIGGRGDLVVPDVRAHVPGHPSATVDLVGPTAHAALPGAPAVTTELRLALEGRAPACEGIAEAILDAVIPETVAVATDALGVGLVLGDLVRGAPAG